MRIRRITQLLVFCFSSAGAQSLTPVESKDYLAEIAAARNEVIETDSFKIYKLDLGRTATGTNRFSALVKNKSAVTLTIGLDLRAQPGLWFRNSQNQFAYQIGPGEETEVEANYAFFRMTPEALLRVRFGIPSIQDGGAIQIRNVLFERKYYIGRANEAADFDLSHFEQYSTVHFEIYCFKGSLASKQIEGIKKQRESGYRVISELLDTSCSTKIRLFLYPDSETKRNETGHTGDGLAVGNNIVEIYNTDVKLDPFHEVAHIIAGQLGEPPAMFNEGFATYSSERLGADALKYLGSPRKKIDRAVRRCMTEGKFIPLDTLLQFTDIGPDESKPSVSYPEAASFVKFLFETRGKDKFRAAYHTLQNSDDANTVAKNRQSFKQIYGISLAEMEKEWLQQVK